MDKGSQHCIGGSDQNYLKEKEMQESKMVVQGGLTNTWEKKRSEGFKRERERYTQLNAEFQRIAGRDKKALSEQCKEMEKTQQNGKD